MRCFVLVLVGEINRVMLLLGYLAKKYGDMPLREYLRERNALSGQLVFKN